MTPHVPGGLEPNVAAKRHKIMKTKLKLFQARSKMKTTVILFASALLLASAGSALAAVHYVNVNSTNASAHEF